MEQHHTDFLTPLQKFRCRKRYHGVGELICFSLLYLADAGGRDAEAGFAPQDAASQS